MVQRPFSETNLGQDSKNSKQHVVVYPGFAQIKSIVHKMQRPKMSTILTSADTGKNKTMFSRMNIARNDILQPFDLRTARYAIADALQKSEENHDPVANANVDKKSPGELSFESYKIPSSVFFPSVEEKGSRDIEQETLIKGSSDAYSDRPAVNSSGPRTRSFGTSREIAAHENANELNLTVSQLYEPDIKAVFYVDEDDTKVTSNINRSLNTPLHCPEFNEVKTDIDAQDFFSEFDIEPSWTVNKHFWNHVYESRYEALMRNAKWPALKVILVPLSHVDTISKQPFESLHKSSARKIISNIVKKLQFYSNLTFAWNEVSHLSQWWKSVGHKSRKALRKLVEEGRLEITTGLWVQTDEATSNLFGILHQLIEGHQWLQHHLNYIPKVAWLTDTVTHSPTLPYLLSASGISNLVLTNLHFSWQQYLTEYQYTDFIWVQSWDADKSAHTDLNDALSRIGNDRYPKHSVITHVLPFNTDGYEACGPQGDICETEFNFSDHTKNQDVNAFNVKEKSEKLLEQYSKTGTTTPHNVIIATLGGKHRYETQTEFDYQYNNYQKIVDYVNINQDIYRATVEFGTSKDYFQNILSRHHTFPTLKGDFLNFADISDGSPAYWTGYFTSKPQFKIVLRRLHSILRTTEILFSFALNLNAFKLYKVSTLYELLLNARECVARLQDRNVVGGTLTLKALSYAQQQIVNVTRDCWYIQETTASLLSSNPTQNETYLEKYLYREGEFITTYKSVTNGDQIFVFNSQSHERVEVMELVTRFPNVEIVDHNEKAIEIQINPVWKFGNAKVLRISSQFFKISFLAKIPPLAFVLYKIKQNLKAIQHAAIIYCTACVVDKVEDGSIFIFNVRQLEAGDIQLENYKHRLIVDEHKGFLKTVIQKSSGEKPLAIDFGAFNHANGRLRKNSIFNTNVSDPMEDILSPFQHNAKLRATIIVSGQITTELTALYGSFLHHTVKIFNVINNPLSDVIKLETKIDHDGDSKHRELEIFLSIQTDISNGNSPELFIDNNGFQYTARTINVSRRVESNMYPFTSMAYIQDKKFRLTVITDHAQGVTALQEGQLVLMMDRRVLFDDSVGSNQGIAENTVTISTHYLLLEKFIDHKTSIDDVNSRINLKVPSHSALHLADTLNYNLDIYFIDANRTHLCHYNFLPLTLSSLPCDVTLINYRAILNRGVPDKYVPNTALMTLHRQKICCFIQNDYDTQCAEGGSFKLDNIFRNVKAIYQTNLVGTTEGVTVNVLNKNNFPSMTLTTLRVYF